jgi:hypothetical protein
MRAGYHACGGAKYCRLETIVRICLLRLIGGLARAAARLHAKPARITE